MAHVYTRKGDKGSTSLVGGERVAKSDIRVETYGTLDELSAQIGLLRDLLTDMNLKADLLGILHDLFVLESLIAAIGTETLKQMPALHLQRVNHLEERINKWEAELPPLQYFVLPGGTATASQCHIARTVCRRAERLCVKLCEYYDVDEIYLSYLNRLSDYLFVAARHIVIASGSDELFWKP